MLRRKMWIWLIPLSIPICLRYICQRNILVQIKLRPYLENWGLQIGSTVYTCISQIQMDSFSLNLIRLERTPGKITVKKLVGPNREIVLHRPPVGHTLVYRVDEKDLPYPYEDGTPCHVSKGEFILFQKVRQRFGWKNEEKGRGTSWPFEQS